MNPVRPQVVAHRGASRDAPENTLEAFRLAWEQGADAIEGDFRLTADNRLVCIHDATTRRTADRSLRVSRSTFADLRKLDVGSWKDPRWAGAVIPSLEEVCACVPRGKQLYLEVKSHSTCTPALRRAIRRGGLDPSRIVVIAFKKRVIAEVRRHIPAVRAYWISDFRRHPADCTWRPTPGAAVRALRQLDAQGFAGMNHGAAGARLATRLREAGYGFNVWTVDKAADARRFHRLGVESITTNRPGWLRALLKTLTP